MHIESSGKISQYHGIFIVWIALLIILLQICKVIFIAATISVCEFLTHSSHPLSLPLPLPPLPPLSLAHVIYTRLHIACIYQIGTSVILFVIADKERNTMRDDEDDGRKSSKSHHKQPAPSSSSSGSRKRGHPSSSSGSRGSKDHHHHHGKSGKKVFN